MPKIKNTNPLKTALRVAGQVVEYGEVIEVEKSVAQSLTKSQNFTKATLADSKASAKSSKKSSASDAETN